MRCRTGIQSGACDAWGLVWPGRGGWDGRGERWLFQVTRLSNHEYSREDGGNGGKQCEQEPGMLSHRFRNAADWRMENGL